ncbi:hypothetical protein [Methyloversatilis discipulorum]|uniref:hypothetical protein n=1 Tax=Methyloversatilis discipulorum TaxID=1119528 RepID=UPI001A592260|nr:hypothetical protein [Methyloversatilis discipulorum]MBL8469680.1 hypothetical protein [Methyloversatilis discipulorum]
MDEISLGDVANAMDQAADEITRLRADLAAKTAECERLRADVKRLKGERRVMADVMDDAAQVIHTIEGCDADEDAALRRLVEKLTDLSTRDLLQTLDATIDAARAEKGE